MYVFQCQIPTIEIPFKKHVIESKLIVVIFRIIHTIYSGCTTHFRLNASFGCANLFCKTEFVFKSATGSGADVLNNF